MLSHIKPSSSPLQIYRNPYPSLNSSFASNIISDHFNGLRHESISSLYFIKGQCRHRTWNQKSIRCVLSSQRRGLTCLRRCRTWRWDLRGVAWARPAFLPSGPPPAPHTTAPGHTHTTAPGHTHTTAPGHTLTTYPWSCIGTLKNVFINILCPRKYFPEPNQAYYNSNFMTQHCKLIKFYSRPINFFLE